MINPINFSITICHLLEHFYVEECYGLELFSFMISIYHILHLIYFKPPFP